MKAVWLIPYEHLCTLSWYDDLKEISCLFPMNFDNFFLISPQPLLRFLRNFWWRNYLKKSFEWLQSRSCALNTLGAMIFWRLKNSRWLIFSLFGGSVTFFLETYLFIGRLTSPYGYRSQISHTWQPWKPFGSYLMYICVHWVDMMTFKKFHVYFPWILTIVF